MAWEDGDIYDIQLNCESIDKAHEQVLKMLRTLFEKDRKEEQIKRDYMLMLDRYIDQCTIEEDMMRTMGWQQSNDHILYHRLIQYTINVFNEPILYKTMRLGSFLKMLEYMFMIHSKVDDTQLVDAWNKYQTLASEQAVNH